MFVPRAEFDKLRAERDEFAEAQRRLAEQNQGLQSDVIAKRKQIDTLIALGDKRLEKLFHVESIELGRYTGGIDTDGRPGHDAIKVYLRPLDRDACVIKAAGDVKVQLFDLAEPPEKNLIAEYTWTADRISRQWAGDFMTYHFSFLCPWKGSPPRHADVTVRVQFVDYLTGRHFTAQKLCTVEIPAPP